MNRFKRMKGLAVLLSICMILGMLQTNSYAYSGSDDTGTSGVGEEIFVGGPDAYATTEKERDGSRAKPYLTLKEAANAINSKGAGSYEVIMLGSTKEASEVAFGNGGDFDISISTEAVSGGAITVSKAFSTGSMIFVVSNTTLTVEGRSDTEPLIFDGGGALYQGGQPLVIVMSAGTLNLNANSSIQNNINTNTDMPNQGGGIANYGTLNLHGGNVSNNRAHFGGGIFNNGSLVMNSGSLSYNNSQKYGGGVYNNNGKYFTLNNGLISNNSSVYGGSGVYNGGVITINGGIITQNSDTCFTNGGTVAMNNGEITSNDGYNTISNLSNGIFNMSGGTISNNKNTASPSYFNAIHMASGDFNLSGGSIVNNSGGNIAFVLNGSFNISGGTINNNAVSSVFSISENGNFSMSDGDISNNSGKVLETNAIISISDKATISGIDDEAGKILINNDYDAYINVSGSLSDISSLSILLSKPREGAKIVSSSTLTQDLLSKFVIADLNYSLDNAGRLVYVGKPVTFYVDAEGSDENLTGSSNDPLLTIQEAVYRFGTSEGIIIIQSDLDVVKPIYIGTNITIKSDNATRVIKQKVPFSSDYSSMFMVDGGILTLGDRDQTDGELIIENEKTDISSLIDNSGTVNLYNRAVIRNAKFARGVIVSSESVTNIDGGSIIDSKNAIILNIYNATVNLASGTISAATGDNNYNIGIENSDTSIVNMSGGSITGFTGNYSCGIYNQGILNISGGIISNNTHSIVSNGSFTMSQSPSIPMGIGNSNGVYLYDYDPIFLKNDFNLSDDMQMLIVQDEYFAGDEVLFGDEFVILNNYDKFLLTDSSYGISETGRIKYIGEPEVYYVDADYSRSDSDGSIAKPFATLEDAVDAIDNALKVGIVYICSDLELDSEIGIESDITILNYGSTSHTITRTSYNSIFFISNMGSLTLGIEGQGDDNVPTLLIEGASGPSTADSIVVNEGILKLYSGVKLYGNEGMGGLNTGAVINSGTFYMYGGVIADYVGEYYGGVRNDNTFIMEGGRITNCSGELAGAIVNNPSATFIMSGGTIEDNHSADGVAIYNVGSIHVSGDASVPMSSSGGNKLCLEKGSYIVIDSDLTTRDKILLTTSTYLPGRQLLVGDGMILTNNYEKFILEPSVRDYRIVSDGTLEYLGLSVSYYVDGESGSDEYTGTKESPFATLNKAVSSIESGGVGSIYICSDLVLEDTVVINKSIKLINEGEAHLILRGPTFKDYMFVVKGQLELGNSELNGQAETRLLTINGNKENVKADRSLIKNDSGSIILNNGIILENNYSHDRGGGIYNDGSLLVKGGVIQNNYSSQYGGGIVNIKNTTINGGSIRHNEAYNGGGGIENSLGTLNISGGGIHGNSASYGGGLENYGGILNISGGSIYDNKAENGGGLALYHSIRNTMSGGEIYGNTGLDEIGTTVGRGVDIAFSSLTVLGNASIASDNEVALYNYDDGPWSWNSYIIVGDSLSEDIPVIKLVKYYFDFDTFENVYYYPIGDQVIRAATGYTLTAQDLSKIQMVDSNYGINSLGKLSRSIKENWFSLVDVDDISYTGSEIRPSLVGMNGSTALVEGRDYRVTYINNINVGAAKVYITGMGNYGGTVIKTFIIGQAYTIAAHAGSNGTITPSGNIYISPGANQSFSIIPAAGYTIASVTIDGVNIGEVKSYTFTNVRSNHSISVTFKAASPQPTPRPTRPPSSGGATPVITPSPVAPIPTGPIVDRVAEVSVAIDRNQQDNILKTLIRITPEWVQLLNNASGEPERTLVTIPIGSKDLTEALRDNSINRLIIDLTLPNELVQNGSVVGNRILLDQEIVSAARDGKKDITISIKNEDGTERYSWSFSGSDLAVSDKVISELDLSLSIQIAKDNEDIAELLGMGSHAEGDTQNNLVINFGHHGDLPAQASVRMYVGGMGYSEGDRLYLYYYNSETGKLDTLPYSSNYLVDSEGYITVNIIHCSEYVLLPRQAKAGVITSLRNQINISPDKIILNLGTKDKNTASTKINLPRTLELVKSLKDKTSSSAIGAVKISYKSGNSKIASVDSSGNITAKKAGKVDIKVTITLYSGKSKTFRVPVTVSKR